MVELIEIGHHRIRPNNLTPEKMSRLIVEHEFFNSFRLLYLMHQIANNQTIILDCHAKVSGYKV
jgi:hypothetical protein